MSFFKKLFGGSEKNEEANIDTDINHQIAYACLTNIGYTSDDANIKNSILETAKITGDLPPLECTEEYIYEECVFYFMTIVELEQSFDFIRVVISKFIQEGTNKDLIIYEEIKPNIQLLCIGIARQRLSKLNIKKTLDEYQAFDLLGIKYHNYAEKLIEHIKCNIPVSKSNFSTGLTPRDHPLKIYLGEIADNLAFAVGLTHANSNMLFLFELSTLKEYSSILTAVKSAVDK